MLGIKSGFAFSLLLSLALVPMSGQENRDQPVRVKNADSCTISLSEFVRGIEKDIKENATASKEIRKLALQVMSGPVKRAKLTAYPREAPKGMKEEIKIEPSKGELVRSGVTWNWELKAILGEVQIYSRAKPVYTRFRVASVGLYLSKADKADPSSIWGITYPDRWFYIVEAAGKGQNGSPPKGIHQNTSK